MQKSWDFCREWIVGEHFFRHVSQQNLVEIARECFTFGPYALKCCDIEDSN